jgi:hypothetical protein
VRGGQPRWSEMVTSIFLFIIPAISGSGLTKTPKNAVLPVCPLVL